MSVESLLERTLNGVSDALIICDRAWRMLYLNAAARAWLELPANDDDVSGKLLWDAAPQLRDTRFDAECSAALREQQPRAFDEFVAQRNAWYDVRVEPADDAVVILMRDVTKARQQQTQATRTRLIRGFSHDLKNPIGAADGHAALLEDGMLGELSEKQRASVARIRIALRNAVGLIDDLVDLALAESGQLEVHRRPLDVRDVARELVEQYRPSAEQAGLGIKSVLEEVDVVQSDEARVRQVLGNLLSNAVKYTPAGGRVEVRTGMRKSDSELQQSGQFVVVDVADTGIGVPADKLDVLFTEFERIDPDVQPGAGLGLAISQRIARLLGGEITVATERGAGSTFTLWLPVTKT
ncbi:MAG: ATP-binding protein [Gemmatimonadota bacterium]